MEAERVFLLPGEYIISKKPHTVTTLLGSCVAVCLYSHKAKFGGVNHYMLPTTNSSEKTGKYGDYSIQTLIQFLERGAGTLKGAEAMMFGGAAVVGAIRSGSNIGDKNVEIARKVLGDHKIPIVKAHTGGNTGMKIKYRTWNNAIEWRYIERSQFADTMLARQDHFEKNRIRVMVVDDSALVRSLLIKAISQEPDIDIVAEAQDAYDAREKVIETNPDVIILDIIMPKMDGVTFLKKLMVYYPKPVIICSTIAKAGSKIELRAENIGAVDVIDKEDLNLYQGLDRVKRILIPKIRTAARSYVRKKTRDEVFNI